MKYSSTQTTRAAAVNTPAAANLSHHRPPTPRNYVAISAAIPALLLALGAAVPTQAQTEVGQFELSPFLGYHFFEDDQNLDDAYTYGLRLGYSFTPNWAVEAAVSFVGTDVDNPGLPGDEGRFTGPIGDVDLMLYQLDALYHFSPQSKFSPYLVAGYGAADYSPSISDNDMATFNLGVGAKYWLSDNLAMRFDLRDYLVGEVFQETYHNISATVGLSFAFGGKAKSAASQTNDSRPVAGSGPTAEENVIVLEFEDIHFDLDQAKLTNEAKTILQRSVTTLKENPKAKVRIAGYTSESGTAEHNQALSERRATAIKNYLVEQGISTRRLSTIGYGDTRPGSYERNPANVNSSAAQKNMRALFEIVVE